ncbi:MAG: histidine phosphatase family protein [Candidatus Moranbacteria bacterium]|nr:histidine phosphatase family protein [Candidatus Moranbacteria bacterium]
MKIILIRHGQSELNAVNEQKYQILSGQLESPLSLIGVKQAVLLKGHVMLDGVCNVFCSDSGRAMETAELAMSSDIPITYTNLLRERSLGVFEGMNISEAESHPELSDYFSNPELCNFRHSFTLNAPGGENYSDVCLRVQQFFGVLDMKQGDSIAIVSHLCTIRCILKFLLDMDEHEVLQLFVPNCHPVEVIRINGKWKLKTELPKRR